MSPQTCTMSVRVVWATLSAARHAGADPDLLLRRSGLAGIDLQNPDLRVPATRVSALWREAARSIGEPCFGWLAGSRVAPGTLGVIDYGARASPDLREALRRLCRFQRLLNDGAELKMVERGDSVRLVQDWSSEAGEARRQWAEFVLSWLVALGRDTTATSWCPRRVLFQDAAPADAAALTAYFGCKPAYSQHASSLVLDKEILDRPVKAADPGLCALLDRLAEQDLARLPRAEDFPGRVRRVIGEQLGRGEPSLDGVARQLCTSARSLQRHLQVMGTSFNELLDGARRDVALQLISDPAVTVSEVAYQTGFSEPSAFDRAFRRWTGNSPTGFRRQVRAFVQLGPDSQH